MSLLEKGDIGCAVQILMLLQAGYARQESGYTRGMVDVAVKALECEIDSYVELAIKPYKLIPPECPKNSISDMLRNIKEPS